MAKVWHLTDHEKMLALGMHHTPKSKLKKGVTNSLNDICSAIHQVIAEKYREEQIVAQ